MKREQRGSKDEVATVESSEVASVSEEMMSQMAFFLGPPPHHRHTDIHIRPPQLQHISKLVNH